MKLDAGFIRLPHRFDTESLVASVRALPEEAWQAHPRGWAGVRVVPLVTAEGQSDPRPVEGRFRPTSWLQDLPDLARLLGRLDLVVGRTLLVELGPGAETERIVEAGYYWHRRVRLFLPLSGGEGADWHSGQERASLADGQAWVIDGWRGTRIEASPDEPLLFLATETVGSAAFWSTLNSADRPLDPEDRGGMSPRQVRLDGEVPDLDTETVRMPSVMPPWEVENLLGFVRSELAALPDSSHRPKLEAVFEQFTRQWHGIWARHGDSAEGFDEYRHALEQAVAQAADFVGQWKLSNGMDGMQLLHVMLAAHALKDAQGVPVRVALSRPDKARRPADASVQQPQTGSSYANGASDAGSEDSPSPLRSVHTRSMPAMLAEIGSSLLVTTYQAGKLAVVREEEGRVNTHFRPYQRPMGLAADPSRMALGTGQAVEFYRNMPELVKGGDPKDRHDGMFLPRRAHVTGNIDIHEMAWAGDELWLVNTRFSCLCTLDETNSFVPRWRPSFISAYAAEDRCHLNGLEVVDGRPRYVTALGTADTAGGWRENKAGGGVLMDVESGEIICRGLSMPHSPRWYDDRLWVLESGNGTLATVDPDSGHLETVAELPGFTRGLSFLGPLAFVGLSQVRESAVFSGIRLTERVNERNCGVWVVDIRSGKQVGFLRFEDAIQEVFAVAALPGLRYPDVLQGSDPRVASSFALPSEAMKEVVAPSTGRSAAGQ